MATKRKLYVFLDHHIRREAFLYRRASKAQVYTKKPEEWMKHSQLIGDDPLPLRKPDFQRSTYYWTPTECVDLIECLLTEQVVPSVILWLSADGYQYVLDGAHRISVLLAWLKDDWGDRIPSSDFRSRQLEQDARDAGQQVRELLRIRNIGSYDDYRKARQKELENEQKGLFDVGITPEEQILASTARKWSSIPLGFPILWVPGDYESARRSFIYINNSGRRLSEWERLLVEHRDSPFMRTVMSIANVRYAEHCWPSTDSSLGPERQRAEQLPALARNLHDALFLPLHETPIRDVTQPLLAVPMLQSERKAPWVAELLTVIEGQHFRALNERRLITQKVTGDYKEVVLKGHALMQKLHDALVHIGRSSDGRALGIQPLVYFYNDQGQGIRGLLYGFLFWLTKGTREDVLTRKRIFSAYRGEFETIFLASREKIIAIVSRRVGSGAEITTQTGRYFDRTVSLIYKHRGKIDTPEFQEEYEEILATLIKTQKNRRSDDIDVSTLGANLRISQSRTFQGSFRSEALIPSFLNSLQICSTCGGRYKPGEGTHIDHKIKHSQGGSTSAPNAAPTHAFCNIEKDRIAAIRSGVDTPEFPPYEKETTNKQSYEQLELDLLQFVQFDEEEEEPEAETLEGVDDLV